MASRCASSTWITASAWKRRQRRAPSIPSSRPASDRAAAGLGLYIVHNLVTGALGGSIDLHTAPGGIHFTLLLPLEAPLIAADPPSS